MFEIKPLGQGGNARSAGLLADGIAPTQLLKDPRVLAHLRQHYERYEGKTFETDDDLRDHFLEDRRFGNLNTFGIAADLTGAAAASDEKARSLAELQAVYDRLPNFVDSTGERSVAGFAEAAGYTLADPLNLIGFGAGGAIGKAAGRGAGFAGRALAREGLEAAATSGAQTLAGATTSGAVRGALVDGSINAGLAGVQNLLGQQRNVELGLQSEVDMGQAGAATALGGAIGGGTGALFGGAGAYRGFGRGVEQDRYLSQVLGLSDDEIAALTPEQYEGLIQRTQQPTGLMGGALDALRTQGQYGAALGRNVRPEALAARDARRDQLAAKLAAEQDPNAGMPTDVELGSAQVAQNDTDRILRLQNLTTMLSSAITDGVDPDNEPVYRALMGQLIQLQGLPQRTEAAIAMYSPDLTSPDPKVAARAAQQLRDIQLLQSLANKIDGIPDPQDAAELIATLNLVKAREAERPKPAPVDPATGEPAAAAPEGAAPEAAAADEPAMDTQTADAIDAENRDLMAAGAANFSDIIPSDDVYAQYVKRAEAGEELPPSITAAMKAYSDAKAASAPKRRGRSKPKKVEPNQNLAGAPAEPGTPEPVAPTFVVESQDQFDNVLSRVMRGEEVDPAEVAAAQEYGARVANEAKVAKQDDAKASIEDLDDDLLLIVEQYRMSAMEDGNAAEAAAARRKFIAGVAEQNPALARALDDVEDGISGEVTRGLREDTETSAPGKPDLRAVAKVYAESQGLDADEFWNYYYAKTKAFYNGTQPDLVAMQTAMDFMRRDKGLTPPPSVEVGKPTTTGRTIVTVQDPQTGRMKKVVGGVQSFLRPTGSTGIIGNVPSKSTLGLEAAKAEANIQLAKAETARRANQPFDAQTIFPFTASGGEPGSEVFAGTIMRDGKKVRTFKKGDTLYYDAITKRAYRSMDDLTAARGESGVEFSTPAPAAAPAPAPKPSGGSAKLAKPGEVTTKIDQKASDEDIAAQISGAPKNTGAVTPLPPEAMAPASKFAGMKSIEDFKAANAGRAVSRDVDPNSPDVGLPPVSKSGRWLAIRNRDTGEIRVVHEKQIAEGATVERLLGKADPTKWEAGYVDSGARSGSSKAKQTFRSVTDDEVPQPSEPMSSIDASTINFAAEAKKIDESLRKTIGSGGNSEWASEYLTKQLALFTKKNGGILNAKAIHDTSFSLSAGFDGLAEGLTHREMLAMEIALQESLARIAPNGIELPAKTKDAAIADFTNVLAGYSKDEIGLIKTVLRALQTNAGPNIRQTGARTSLEADNTINLPSIKGYVESAAAGIPRHLLTPVHEIGHWAFYNILKPSDRLEYLRHFSANYLTADGLIDRSKVLARGQYGSDTSALTNLLSGSNELFAHQFALVVMNTKKLGGGRDGIGRVLENPLSGEADRVASAAGRIAPAQKDPVFMSYFSRAVGGEQYAKMIADLFNGNIGAIFSRVAKFSADMIDAIFDRKRIDKDIERIIGRAFSPGYGFREPSVQRRIDWSKIQTNMGRKSIDLIERFDDTFEQIRSGLDPEKTVTMARQLVNDLAFLANYTPTRKLAQKLLMVRQEIADIINGSLPEESPFAIPRYEDDLENVGNESGSLDWDDLVTSISDLDILSQSLVEYMDGPQGMVFRLLFDPKDESKGFSIMSRLTSSVLDSQSDKTVVNNFLQAKRDEKYVATKLAKEGDEAAAAARAEVEARREKEKKSGSERSKTNKQADIIRKMSNAELYSRLKQIAKDPEKNGEAQLISDELTDRARTQPKPLPVNVPREIKQMRTPELQVRRDRAILSGDQGTVASINYEIWRRAEKRRNAAAEPKTNELIRNLDEQTYGLYEELDRLETGAPYVDDGIPPGLPANIADTLSTVTHRNPDIRIAARRIGSRMYIAAGRLLSEDKPTRIADFSVNSMEDVRQVVGGMRKSLRRLAIDLNSPRVSPEKAVSSAVEPIAELVAKSTGIGPSRETISDLATATRLFLSMDGDSELVEKIANGFGITKTEAEDLIIRTAETTGFVFGDSVRRADVLDAYPELAFIRNPKSIISAEPVLGRKVVSPIEAGSVLSEIRSRFRDSIYRSMTSWARDTKGGGINLGIDGDNIIPYYGTFDGAVDGDVFTRSPGKYGNGIHLTSKPDTRKAPSTNELVSMVYEMENPPERIVRAARVLDRLHARYMNRKMEGKSSEQTIATYNELRDRLTGYFFDSKIGVAPAVIRTSNPLDASADMDGQLSAIVGNVVATMASRAGIAITPTGQTAGEVLDSAIAAVRRSKNPAFNEEAARALVGSQLASAGFDSITWVERTNGGGAIRHVSLLDTGKSSKANQNVRSMTTDFIDSEPEVRAAGQDVTTYDVGLGAIFDAVELGDTKIDGEQLAMRLAEELGRAGVKSADARLQTSVLRSRPLNERELQHASGLLNPIENFRDSMARTVNDSLMGRTKDALDATAGEALSRTFGSLTGQAARYGFRWLANQFDDLNPAIQSQLGKTLGVIMRDLPEMSGFSNRLRNWKNRSLDWGYATRKLTQQPKSHERILKALRRGTDSDAYKGLNADERKAFNTIRDRFSYMLTELRAQGVMMGEIKKNYVPQIWDIDHIRENKDQFLKAMGNYFVVESRSGEGRTPLSPDEAVQIAERVYDKLTIENGIYIHPDTPNAGGRVTSDSTDYGRLIRLDQFPEALNDLEQFLEGDLMTTMVKYFDGASRVLENSKRFGYHDFAFNDYLYVVDNGLRGVTDLLSKNKVFSHNVKSASSGEVSESSFVDEMLAPFNNFEQANRAATEGLRVLREGGEEAAKRFFASLYPGQLKPHQMRRVDAIVGALYDFDGQRPQFKDRAPYRHAIVAKALVDRKGHPSDMGGGLGQKFSQGMRGFTGVTLLGFTTLASLGDTVLPLIKSGSFTSFAKGWRDMIKDPDFRQMSRELGVSLESVVHNRITNLYGGTGGKVSNAFFNMIGLEPWTATMRNMAAGVGIHSMRYYQQVATRNFNKALPLSAQNADFKFAYRWLKNFELQDYATNGQRIEVSDMKDNEAIRRGVIRFVDKTVFSPSPDELPAWAQTWAGSLIFQLKSFPLLMTRYGLEIVQGGGSTHNMKRLALLAIAGPAVATGSLALRDVVQQRGEDDNTFRERSGKKWLEAGVIPGLGPILAQQINDGSVTDHMLGWYIEAFFTAGGLGLLTDFLKESAEMDEVPAIYRQDRLVSLLGGPNVGFALNLLGTLTNENEESNSDERSDARLFAQRVPILGGIKPFRDSVVDTVAGPRQGRDTGGGMGGGMGSGMSDGMGGGM